MTCQELQTLLNAWLDGELPQADNTALHSHLSNCAACRTLADELQGLDAQLRRLTKPQRSQAQRLAAAVLQKLPTDSFSYWLPLRKRSIWRGGIMALAAAAAGFLLAWLLLPAPQVLHPDSARPLAANIADPNPNIQLTIATGKVEVQQNGQWQSMPTGGRIGCGQLIRTPERGCCEFRTPDGSEVRLNNQTQVLFETHRKVRLDQGQIWSTVAPGKEQFQVIAALTTITAIATQFDVSQTSEKTLLSVLEGNTQVKTQGTTTNVPAGHQFWCDGKTISSVRAENEYQLLQATSWVNEILVLKGRSNPELVRRIDDIFAGIGETKMGFMEEKEIRLLGDHCVVPLTRYLQSPRSQGDPSKRQLAARLIADLAQPRSIGDMIPILTDHDPLVRSTIATGLKRLTKTDQGLSPQALCNADPSSCQSTLQSWQRWWNENQSRCPAESK